MSARQMVIPRKDNVLNTHQIGQWTFLKMCVCVCMRDCAREGVGTSGNRRNVVSSLASSGGSEEHTPGLQRDNTSGKT